jgi:hypothetical protein
MCGNLIFGDYVVFQLVGSVLLFVVYVLSDAFVYDKQCYTYIGITCS